MKIIFHLIKKDLRLIWPNLALWIVSMAMLYFWAERPSLVQQSILVSPSLYATIYGLLWLSLFPAIVQTDVPLGTTEFWMTRPISPAVLFTAKVIEATFLTLVVALLLHGSFLLGQGFNLTQVFQVVLHLALVLLAFGGIGFFFSSQTRNITQFWMFFLGTAVCLFLVSRALDQLGFQRLNEEAEIGRFKILSTLCIVGGITVAALQYRYRSRSISGMVALGFVLALLATLTLWRWPFNLSAPPARDRIVWQVQRAHEGVDQLLSDRPSRSFVLQVVSHPDETVRLTRTVGEVVWSDGTSSKEARIRELYRSPYVGLMAAVQAAFGPELAIKMIPPPSEGSLKFSAEVFEKKGLSPRTFKGTMLGERIHFSPLVSLPLIEGARARSNGYTVQILRVSAGASDQEISVYAQSPTTEAAQSLRSMPFFFLVNRSRKEARILDPLWTKRMALDSSIPGLAMFTMTWSIQESQGREVEQALDDRWLSEAQLYVFELMVDQLVEIPVECSLE